MTKDGTKSGKGSRSSKTARVLSLLTDPESAENEVLGEMEADKEASEAQRISDETAERQIHDALASELAGLAPEPERAAEAKPEPSPVIPVAETAGAVPFVPEAFDGEDLSAGTPAPVAEPKPQPAPVTEAAPSRVTFQTSAAAPDRENDEEYTVLNVTQALVEEKAEKYIKMLGLCGCNRCHIDVIALALSDLPAKYVVVKGKDINPRLSYYESKYSSAVITAVMSACKKVNEKPHHKR